MGLFSSDNPKEEKHKGILGAFSVDTIKWEPENDQEASLVVHKHIYEDFPNGSYLIVAPSQMAVFTNNMDTGSSTYVTGDMNAQMSIFTGPCKIKLETGDSRFAPFRNISHSLTGGESAFHSTVYFVNTTYMNELSWGTQAPVVIQDPEEEVNVHVRAFGMFGVHLEQVDTSISTLQVRKFLQKVVGTRADYTRDELVNFMRAKILEYVPDLLAKTMVDQNVGILRVSTKLSEFSDIIKAKLVEHFDSFGLTLDNFSFHNINVPDDDLNEINEMKIKRKRDRLEAEGSAAKMDIESAARARMREREGYTYQQEQAFGVMGKAAENEGQSSGFMNAGMGLGMGMGLGGAFGAGMGAMARDTIGNMNLMQQGMQPGMNPYAQPGMQQGMNPYGQPGMQQGMNPYGQPGMQQGMNPYGQPAMQQGMQGQPAQGGLTCVNCGKPLPPNAKFCLECGTKVEAAKKCPGCGEPLVQGAKFCLNCGQSLTEQ